MAIRFVDLFCGIGGFHQGIKNVVSNATCVMASDIDPKVREVYKDNYNVEPMGDITKLDIQNIPKFNLLCGGFPCQPFSVAQWKEAKAFNDPRGNMFFEIMKIVNFHKPSCIFLENVANLVTIEKGKVFELILETLKAQGYYVSYCVLNAKDFGVPQNRERVYIVASLEKEFDFTSLKAVKNSPSIVDILEDCNENVYIDESKYIILDNSQVKQQQKSGLIFQGYIKGNIRKNGARENTEHLSRVHKQPMRIYNIKGTHPTLSASESSGRYHIYDHIKHKVRKLSLDECYNLMAFPKTFKKHASSGIAYKQIGNSVCVRVIENIIYNLSQQNIIKT
jgi:DNA (cytosine-5)-methyltransferase 1